MYNDNWNDERDFENQGRRRGSFRGESGYGHSGGYSRSQSGIGGKGYGEENFGTSGYAGSYGQRRSQGSESGAGSGSYRNRGYENYGSRQGGYQEQDDWGTQEFRGGRGSYSGFGEGYDRHRESRGSYGNISGGGRSYGNIGEDRITGGGMSGGFDPGYRQGGSGEHGGYGRRGSFGGSSYGNEGFGRSEREQGGYGSSQEYSGQYERRGPGYSGQSGQYERDPERWGQRSGFEGRGSRGIGQYEDRGYREGDYGNQYSGTQSSHRAAGSGYEQQGYGRGMNEEWETGNYGQRGQSYGYGDSERGNRRRNDQENQVW